MSFQGFSHEASDSWDPGAHDGFQLYELTPLANRRKNYLTQITAAKKPALVKLQNVATLICKIS